ncbi:NAD-glutamate dehydrogenase [Halopseudomonas pachastrellae]|nr:NAD-glutamate dehydrogenase [Halopseudomonas pachastrellae]
MLRPGCRKPLPAWWQAPDMPTRCLVSLKRPMQPGRMPSAWRRCFFALGSQLHLPWFSQQVNSLPVDNHWQALARESYRDTWTGRCAA